jgi:hypothetical protein
MRYGAFRARASTTSKKAPPASAPPGCRRQIRALGSDVSLGTGLEIQQMIRHGHLRRGPDGRDQQRAQALGWLAEHIGAVAEGKVAGLLIAAGDPP